MKGLLASCAAAALVSAGAWGASAQDVAAPLNLASHLTQAAAAYDGYVRRTSAIAPRFADGASVQHALSIGADYQPEQLEEGMVAFSALLALRDQDFVAGVRQAAADPAFAQRLIDDPDSVLQAPGATEAAADVEGALRTHGRRLRQLAAAITQQAYTVQLQAWSKAPVPDAAGVLARVKAEALTTRVADVAAQQSLLQSLDATPRTTGWNGAVTPQVTHGLALAALAVLGQAGDNNEAQIAALLRRQIDVNCVRLARMDLNQCLAAAGPHYDDVFCTGEHAVGETAKCVSAAAGDTGDADTPPQTDVATPAAFTPAAYGPEEAAAYGLPAPATTPEGAW